MMTLSNLIGPFFFFFFGGGGGGGGGIHRSSVDSPHTGPLNKRLTKKLNCK